MLPLNIPIGLAKMDWIRRKDNELSDQYIDFDFNHDPNLLVNISSFCGICATLVNVLTTRGALVLADDVAFVRRKWLFRLAFLSCPVPEEPRSASLPADLSAELETLGLSDPFGRRIRCNLSDDRFRDLANRILSSSPTASGPVETVVRILSSKPYAPLTQPAVLDLKLGGYVSTPSEDPRLWCWDIKILLGTNLPIIIHTTDDDLPTDIQLELFDLIHADENRHDSTPTLLVA